ncbi:MAG: hypothetical protein K2W95_30950 [Candidatus Obscuribacterales bacterium]|nr:hypothetical protein [Candidatus Obscuribacterales bacterium]
MFLIILAVCIAVIFGAGKLLIRHWRKLELAKRAQRAKRLATALAVKSLGDDAGAKVASMIVPVNAAQSKRAVNKEPVVLAVSEADAEVHIRELIRMMEAVETTRKVAQEAVRTLERGSSELRSKRHTLDYQVSGASPVPGDIAHFHKLAAERVTLLAEADEKERSLPSLLPALWATRTTHKQALANLSRVLKKYSGYNSRTLPPRLVKAHMIARKVIADGESAQGNLEISRRRAHKTLKEVKPTPHAVTPTLTSDQQLMMGEITALVEICLTRWQVCSEAMATWTALKATYDKAVTESQRTSPPADGETAEQWYRRLASKWPERFKAETPLPAAGAAAREALSAFTTGLCSLSKRKQETLDKLVEGKVSRWYAPVVLPQQLSIFRQITARWLEYLNHEESRFRYTDIVFEQLPTEGDEQSVETVLADLFAAMNSCTKITGVPCGQCPGAEDANRLGSKADFPAAPTKPNDSSVAEFMTTFVDWAQKVLTARREGTRQLEALRAVESELAAWRRKLADAQDRIRRISQSQAQIVAQYCVHGMVAWLENRAREWSKPITDLRNWKLEPLEPATAVVDETPTMDELRKLCRALGFALAQRAVSAQKQTDARGRKRPSHPSPPGVASYNQPIDFDALMVAEGAYLDQYVVVQQECAEIDAASAEAQGAHNKRATKVIQCVEALKQFIAKVPAQLGAEPSDELRIWLDAATKLREVVGR